MSKTVLNPYLTFGGNARQAMEFYRQVLGGTLDVQTFSDFGAPVSDSYKEKLMHARIDADGMVLMASDAQEGSTPVAGDNVTLSLSGGSEDGDRLTKIFTALADGGTTTMPLGDVPWGATFGMCTDRFGLNWMVNIEKSA
jgi:PhnB protein